MQKFKSTFICTIYIVILMIMVSCKDTERVLTSATGTIYECLVVMNNESLTQEELEAVAKKSSEEEYSAFSQDISTTYGLVETIMGAEMPCMPQPESYFKLTHVTMSMFDNVLKPTRNILIVDINPKKYTKVTTKVNSDVWSTPQAVCHIQAPSQQEFVNYWLEKGEWVRDWFVNQELSRQGSFYRSGYNQDARNILQEQNYDMLIPNDYMVIKDTIVEVKANDSSNKAEKVQVLWCCNNKGSTRRDVLVYSYPYIDENTFTLEFLNARRDAVLSQLVTGSVEGSYMGTEYNIMPPQMRTINVQNNATAYEIRGLWKLKEGEAMGGPYVSHTRLDKTNSRIVTTETFLFAPGQKKRNPYRQAEAILYTLTLPEDNVK
jgi:hypothetical protein